ncbi:MAG: hypothetical protein ACFFET_10945 [Candidatus Thorarchaeota archaeon]
MTRLAFVQLNSCSGCLFSLLANPVFPDIIKSADICYFPIISDQNSVKRAEIAFVEGCVTSESEANLIRQLYTDGAKIVALGTCAVLGGIMSQSENMQVCPVGKYVDLHALLPGCPPPQYLTGNLLLSAIQGTDFILPEKNVCAECPYTLDQDYSTEINCINPPRPPKSCFIREGVLCLGPITRAGCEARCLMAGTPCDGCFGTLKRSMPAAIANFFSVLKISPKIRKLAALALRYQKPELGKS